METSEQSEISLYMYLASYHVWSYQNQGHKWENYILDIRRMLVYKIISYLAESRVLPYSAYRLKQVIILKNVVVLHQQGMWNNSSTNFPHSQIIFWYQRQTCWSCTKLLNDKTVNSRFGNASLWTRFMFSLNCEAEN